MFSAACRIKKALFVIYFKETYLFFRDQRTTYQLPILEAWAFLF